MKKSLWIVIIILVIIVGYLAVRSHKNNLAISSTSTSKAFKIGEALPVTGVYASFGEEFERGARIAEDEINQSGGNVKVIVEDTSLEAKKAVDAVNKLVSANNVDAVVVSAFVEAAASHQISDKKGVPTLVLWDSNPQLEAMGNSVFALGPWTPASGEITAKFMYNRGVRTAGVFADKQDWAVAVSEAFIKTFEGLGGKVTKTEYVSPGTKDYRGQLSKIIATSPEVLYATAEDFLVVVKQSKDLGYKGMIMTSDLLDNALIAEQPELFEGVYGSQVADPVANKTAHYAGLYKKKYGEDPRKLLYGTWGYDGVQVLYAAHKLNTDKSLAQNLYSLPIYKGASGDIKFDENGSSKTIPKMFVVKKGEIVKVE